MPFLTFGQYDPKIEEYQHKKIITETDTINYQIYSKGNIKEKNKILTQTSFQLKDNVLKGHVKATLTGEQRTG